MHYPKYAHHILLRYLTSPLARESEVEAYLSEKSNWLSGDGHPWEMISFYRAFLCDDPEEKLEHLEEAAEIAPESGEGVLLVIAALIEGARMLLDPTRETVYRELVSRCIAELPLLGERGNILLDHIDKKYEPLELARLVLPFNFR